MLLRHIDDAGEPTLNSIEDRARLLKLYRKRPRHSPSGRVTDCIIIEDLMINMNTIESFPTPHYRDLNGVMHLRNGERLELGKDTNYNRIDFVTLNSTSPDRLVRSAQVHVENIYILFVKAMRKLKVGPVCD
jgi:hypothetical protein